MITLHPAQDLAWPEAEESPYVDWWQITDQHSGARENDETGLTLVSFAAVPVLQNRAAKRYCALTGGAMGPLADAAPKRVMPLWQQSLPHKSDGQGVARPQTEFGAALPAVAVRPKAVMVIMDTAINPLHEQFLAVDGGTRIVAHWLMEGPWTADQRVPFGRENRTDQINAVLADAMLGDRQALAALGVVNFKNPFAPRGAAQLDAHGTHILGLAAGTDPQAQGGQDQALREVPILAVSLPSNRLLSGSGIFLDVFVDQAIEWITRRLTDLYGADWPAVVVNLSYGLAAGPKDGSGQLNARIRDWLATYPALQLFMPAGNDGLAQGHAVLRQGQGIGWMLPPADPLSSFAEIWIEHWDEATQVILTPPGGPALYIPLQPGRAFDLRDGVGAGPLGRVYGVAGGADHGKLGCVICLAPSRPPLMDRPSAPAGVWQIAVTGPADLRAAVHLQSERPLVPNSHTNRPSRLVPLAEGAVGPQRAGTLNAVGPGTGAQIITSSLGRAAEGYKGFAGLQDAGADGAVPPQTLPWASRGAADAVPPFGDGVAYPGDRSVALQGLRAPGATSGSCTAVSGTSFSTALASRAALLALLIQDQTDPAASSVALS